MFEIFYKIREESSSPLPYRSVYNKEITIVANCLERLVQLEFSDDHLKKKLN